MTKSRPEEKIAQKVIKKYNLQLPIDVHGLIQQLADVEEDDLPVNVDAIFLNKGRKKPLVILNRDRSPLRKRFTLGHEIGHILIPWHIGTLVCHTEGYSSVDEFLYDQIEHEANRFSTELLMPSSFIEKVVEKKVNIQDIIETIFNECEVSVSAACLRIVSYLDPGYVCNIEYDSQVVGKYKSPETAINLYSDIDWEHLTNASSEHGNFRIQNYTVNWWKFGHSNQHIFKDVPKETAPEILNRIVQSVESDPDVRQHVIRVINGICGSANNRSENEVEYYNQLKQRVINRPDLRHIVNHSEFDDFLRKKVIEVMNRKKRK
jgi:Zn-dependent peptidase ImmA (M78 family)